jgi:hypothetical protein
MTQLSPPAIIGSLAILATIVVIGLVCCGFWTIITGREIVCKLPMRFRMAELLWIAVFKLLQGKNLALVSLHLLGRRLRPAAGMTIRSRRRRSVAARWQPIVKEIVQNLLPLPEPKPRRSRVADAWSRIRDHAPFVELLANARPRSARR